ncbi:polysaccharide deacetylase family protein [Aliterella atlantica]|uniref:polysaccharide deacetylase family protein n=1 Tax=Aliterella atlantica TaxID=1827278 RepID=UPI0009E22C9F|nr:polysaccharide deacetylase family protein [Aliterella atlantica]
MRQPHQEYKKLLFSCLASRVFKIFIPIVLYSPLLVTSTVQATPSTENSCQNPLNFDVELSNVVSDLFQVASWLNEPKTVVATISQSLGPQMAAYFNPSVSPNINERAKLARVPVFMYHDVLAVKEVFFDVTYQDFAQHLRLIKEKGLTPISFDQLVTHLRTGLPLPEKPIMLTFDDGYGGHYEYVYPLLKKYGYPAVFSVYTHNMGKNTGRSHVNWQQLKEMAADPLITIASHSITHPRDLRELSDARLQLELTKSKKILEAQLGIPIRYFTYPEGKYDQRVAKAVQEAGYQAALTMSDTDERYAGQSDSMLAISRFGQSRLAQALTQPDVSPIAQAWGGAKLPSWGGIFDFSADVEVTKTTLEDIPLTLISGGKPVTIHAKSRSQVAEIIAGTQAVAAVDGGFFSLRYLNSNVMIGPVLSQINNQFIPGNKGEIPKLAGRPLVLISPQAVKFISFDPFKHNTLAGIQAEMPNVTDAFVAAAWLVKDNQPQLTQNFANLYGFDALRHRAFWGIDRVGKPTIGVSNEPVDSISLGAALGLAGLRDAVMLDSGASTSLVYKGDSLVGYTPRPVPHVVALMPPNATTILAPCTVAQK